MPIGEHLYGFARTGTRRYHARPPANCRSAREAWDYHAEKGPVVWLQLLDGYWGACRENGDIDETENTFAANRWLKSDGCEACNATGRSPLLDVACSICGGTGR